jgi:hypothetical protein
MAIEKTSTLPSLPELLQQIQLDIGDNVELYLIVAFMAVMLTLHGIAVLVIASAFHALDRFLKTIPHLAGGSFISYFIAILLIILTHIIEIVAWTYVLVAFAVFPEVTQTFYFVGEMYTTLGFGNYPLDIIHNKQTTWLFFIRNISTFNRWFKKTHFNKR